MADDFSFQLVPLRSDSGVGDIEILQEGRHQDRVTHDGAVIRVPQFCQASVFLQRMLRVVGSGELLGPPSWKLADFCIMAAWLLAIAVVLKVRQHQSMGGYLPLPTRLCFLAFLPLQYPKPSYIPRRRQRLHVLHLDPWALAGALLAQCETSSVFPRCCCCVLWENRDAASRTAFQSIIPKQFFSTQDLADQIADFPVSTSEVVVSIPSSCRHLSRFQQSPELADHSWLLRDFLAQAVAYRKTTRCGSCTAEARRSSVSRNLSRSVRATSRMGQFESGLSSRRSPGGTGCEL